MKPERVNSVMVKALVTLRSRLNTFRDVLFRGLFRARFRYDVFISYSHRDAREYAANLNDQLSRLDFSCFIDKEESPPGSSLDPTLARALRKSAVLVLLATERALTRPYIVSEFEKFATTERRIIPINIGGALSANDEAALTRAPWNIIKSRNLIWIDEDDVAFTKQVPSPQIADGIDKQFKYTRRNTRVRTEIIGTAALVLLAAVGAGFVIKGQAKEVTKQAALAEVARKETAKQQDIAHAAGQEAQRQLELAEGHDPYSAGIASLAFSPEGKLLASGGHDNIIKLWDLKRQVEVATLRGHSASVSALAFSPDGKTLISGDWNETIKLWDVPSMKEKATLKVTQIGQIRSIEFSPDGRLVVAGGDLIRVWDVRSRSDLATFADASSPSFSSDGKTLAGFSGQTNTVKFWDVTTWQETIAVKGPSDSVVIRFLPGRNTLVTGSSNGWLSFWFAHKTAPFVPKKTK